MQRLRDGVIYTQRSTGGWISCRDQEEGNIHAEIKRRVGIHAEIKWRGIYMQGSRDGVIYM